MDKDRAETRATYVSVYHMLETNARAAWLGLGTLGLGMVLLFMNTTMINVALPELSAALGAGTAELEWIVASYNLAFLAVLLPGGAVGDRVGHHRTLACGVLLFCLGALTAALSGRIAGLMAGRVVMGLGASVFTPMSLALIPQLFPPKLRGKATGLWTAAGALGAPLGPIVGGAMIDAWGWRAMFVLDLVAGLFLLVLCLLLVPRDGRSSMRRALPWPQVLASTAGFSLLTWGLINAEHSWEGWLTWGPLTSGLVVLTIFIALERHSTDKLTDLHLLRLRRFREPATALLLINFILFGLLFVAPSYLQTVLGNSAVIGGMMLMPLAVTGVAGSLVAGVLPSRGRSWVLPAALGVVAFGLWLSSHTTVDSGYSPMFWGLAVAGFGLGLAQSFGLTTAMSAVPDDADGAGAALLNTLRQFGSVLGIALIGSLSGQHYTGDIPKAADQLAPAIGEAVRDSVASAHEALLQLPSDIAEPLLADVDKAYVSSMRLVLAGCSLIALLACVAGLVIAAAHRRRIAGQ